MISLDNIDSLPPEDLDKDEILEETKRIAKEIGRLQHIMYAVGKENLLVILQGMDASGKDGTTMKVFGQCSPTGIDVYSFKKPTEPEMNHDFLWRVHQRTPAKGMLVVFNRSHYEDILIQRVHDWIDEERVHLRMDAINAFEKLLIGDNQTHILKFFLHISRDKQREELQERIDQPDKNWKHNPNDWKESAHWEEYRTCYEYAINNSEIPWNIIPADKGWYRNYCVAKHVLKCLQDMNLQLPRL